MSEKEEPDQHLLESLEELPLSVSHIIDGRVVHGVMVDGVFVQEKKELPGRRKVRSR